MKNQGSNNLFISKSIWGQTHHLADLLAKKGEDLFTKRIVICEEKFTLTLEKLLAKKLGGIMSTRVMSFGKICDTLKSSEKYLTKTSEIMLLTKIIAEIAPDLTLFSSVASRPTLANSIYEILSLIASSNVNFEELEKKTLPPSLQTKVADICKIHKAYTNAKKGLYLDATDKMEALYQSLESVEILQDAEIYLVGHTSFTGQMSAVIQKLISRGNVSIYALDSNVLTAKKLLGASEIPFEITEIKENFPPLTIDIHNAIQAKNSDQTQNPLHLLKFSSKIFEVENISLKIKHLIQNGTKPEDITLILANFESDLERYTTALENLGVPYFASKSETLEKFPFPQFLIIACELAISKFALPWVKNALSSPFCPLTQAESYDFENFLISRNVDRGRFLKDDIFIKNANLDIRNKFLDGTNLFKNQALTAVDFANICEDFAKNHIADFAYISCNLTGENRLAEADLLAISLKKTLEVLAEMKTILGEEVFSLETLKTVFEGGLCGKEIATIPAKLHAVEITDVAGGIMHQTPHAFITSCGASYFPIAQKDTAILSDKDIATLSTENISISPSVEFLNDNSVIIAIQSMLSARDSLTLSFSEIAEIGKELPSEFFTALSQISQIKHLESEYHYPLASCGFTLEETLDSREKTIAVATKAIEETAFSIPDLITLFAREFSKEHALAREISSRIYTAFEKNNLAQYLDEIAKRNNVRFTSQPIARKEYSPSMLEKYFTCPYACFLNNSVGIKDREQGVLQSFDSGIFLHDLLDQFTKIAPRIEETQIKQEVARISKEITEKPAFAKFMGQEKIHYLLSRLTAEGEKICHHIYKANGVSNFKPTYHEYEFGGNRPVTTQEGLSLRGKADRVDVCGNDIVVIDYKTGAIDTKETSFYYGVKIQSELYLYAVSKLTGKNPCGCVYLPISDNYGDKPISYKMQGKISATEEVLKNLDTTVEYGNASEIYPIKIKKEGGYYKDSALLSKEDFEKHIDQAIATANMGKTEIEKGYIFPTPFKLSGKDSCEYCKFTSICKTCGEENVRGDKFDKEESKDE